MHYIKGCPCLFKVAWIADHALKNIYVIQKCASCGYTKEQCDYVFEELKSMKIVDTKPESAYISDLYQTYGELPFHCEEVDTNFHFEPECQEVDLCKICEFSKDFCNCQLNAELQVLRYMYHNPTVSMIRRNVFHMQICIILEQMGHIKGYLLPLGEQLYKAFKDARKRTSASFLYDKEKLLDHILNENRGILPEQYVLAARKILRNLLDAILIENEVCSAKRYEDCLKKLRAAPAYQGRERQQFFEDICIYDEISYLFFEAVAVEFGQKDDRQLCPEEAQSAHKKKILVPTYSDRPALSLEELMSQASMSAGFLGHEAKEERKTSGLNCPENFSKSAPDAHKNNHKLPLDSLNSDRQAHFEIRENQAFSGEKVPMQLLKTVETMPENTEYMLDFLPDSDHISRTSGGGTETGSDKNTAQKEELKKVSMAFMTDEGALLVEDGDVIDIHNEDFLPFCAVVSLEEWLTMDYAKRERQEGLFITVASRRCAYFLNKNMIKPLVFEYLLHVIRRPIYTYSVYLVWRILSMNGLGNIRPKAKIYSLSALYNAVQRTDQLQPMADIVKETASDNSNVYSVTALYKRYVTSKEPLLLSEDIKKLYRHYVNVEYAFGTSYKCQNGDFLCRKTFLSCEFSPFDLEEKKKDQTFICYEISQDLISQNALPDILLATRYTIVQALTEPIFIRSNAKLVALDASSFSLIVDTRNRHIIDEMDQILMSRYAHLLSESGCRMPVIKRYWI